MAKDDRLYLKLTLDFSDHAKILPLSDAAFRCLIEAIAYSRKHLTDGLLARRYALARWSLETLRELCDNDPEKPSLIECEQGWRIHDYAEIQDTRAEVEARRERNRMAGKQGGLARAKRVASKSLSKSLSETQAETETETETKEKVRTPVQREQHSGEAEPPHSPAIAATRGADLVRANIPNGHPNATLTSLRLQASELINTGTDPEVVAQALRLWSDKPSVGIGRTILSSMCSEVIKTRTTPRRSTTDQRITDAQALKAKYLAAENSVPALTIAPMGELA